jgi:hypothetical protein
MPCFAPEELMGRTFVRSYEDGSNYRATIVRKIMDQHAENHSASNFLVKVSDGEFDKKILYWTFCKLIEDLEDQDINPKNKFWIFQSVLGHEGPFEKTIKGIPTMY